MEPSVIFNLPQRELRNSGNSFYSLISVAFILFFFSTTNSQAHGLIVTTKIEKQMVTVIVTFDSGEPADDCEVSVKFQEMLLLKGMTNPQGEFPFEASGKGEYLIIADAGAGHLVKKVISIGESVDPSNERPASRILTSLMGLGLIGLLVLSWLWIARRARHNQLLESL
jgi:hypothetical protein